MPLRPSPRFAVPKSQRYSTIRFPPVDSLIQSEGEPLPTRPTVLRQHFRDIPAITKWFRELRDDKDGQELDECYIKKFGYTTVPLELARPDSFERFDGHLGLLLTSAYGSIDAQDRLYIAQCPLGDLHPDMQADVPTPSIINQIGRGDIYGSSLWMGRPPTRTPLHRDPNPNLFVQLAGTKVIRLMEPGEGRRLFEQMKAEGGSAHVRGAEMMVGGERDKLEDAVWGDDERVTGWEAQLERGDGLFIPLGWWHAVRGVGTSMNASVNWWFR